MSLLPFLRFPHLCRPATHLQVGRCVRNSKSPFNNTYFYYKYSLSSFPISSQHPSDLRFPIHFHFSALSATYSFRSILSTFSATAMAKSILVTGEAGYIGSDRVLQLLLGGFKVVVVDNLDNDSEIAVRRVAEIAGEVGKKNLVFHKVDLQDKEALGKIFAASSFDAVIHFAGLKAVGESVQKPPPNNDVIGLINVLETMAAYGCKKGCGSSSSIEAHSELGQETQRQALETEGQIKKWWTFLYRLVSKLKAANNQTPIYPDDLKAKTVLILGFTALLGLLGVSYRINGHGNMVPTALFHKPTNTFTFFLMIIMMMVYCAAIGLMLAKACPRIAKVLNVISFLCLLLGVTVLLWTLCPRSINWIPWAFFACPFVAAFGVAVYWLFTETSSATASLRSSSHPPSQV